jgi:hypothetical protein
MIGVNKWACVWEETYIYAECKDMGYEARNILSGQ